MIESTAPAPIAIIAEDEVLGRLLLREAAVSAGLTPLVFDNGRQALEAAMSQDVAIILLDVDMPEMDGYTVCRRLRQSARHSTVPIVMVTGHDDIYAIDAAFKAGATDYISKPVNWALLPHRLAYIMRNAAAARRIEQLAYFDALTGLPNRQCCMDQAGRLLANDSHRQGGVGFIHIDLNNFKRINDTFGRAVGDLVLKRVASLLSEATAAFAPGDVALARLEGAEFAILVRSDNPRETALGVAAACCAALEEPVRCNQLEFFVTPSIGVAVCPDDGTDAETLLKHADTAMYQSKNSGVATISSYAPAMSARLRDWLELEARLRRAVRDDLLCLRYQPKVSLLDGSLSGLEALVRWYDEEHGEISPNRFIPIAEESHLIVDIGAWVVNEVCRQLRAWLDRGVSVAVAINVSGKDLLYGNPAQTIATAASQFGIPPSLIEVEITESVFVTDSTAGGASIRRLRELGCRVALDDFGTGYSSLSYLTRFPPDRLKIDRSFVQNVDVSRSDAGIINAILSLAKTLDLTITAEGVERQGQLEWLRARGCHEAQGFLIAPPLTPAELEAQFLGCSDHVGTRDCVAM